ncbi:MAG TPA: WecB/TagA/CpsF family glycosyltransferase [Tepidisphaeraceae bacterium]|nr:WecB/TagA/CpsF family glycosyltransferase [Tepidisphaeraceae bacterium]
MPDDDVISIATPIPTRARHGLPERVRLMGMPIDPVTNAQAVSHIVGSVTAGRGGWVITPNLDQLRLYHHRPELRGMYEQADLILADGMPLLWAAKVQQTPLPERVAGSELIYTLSEAAAKANLSAYFLGGNPGMAEGAGRRLSEMYPGLRVAGHRCPPMGFDKSDAEMAAIVEDVSAARPDIVYVGLGFPKQEKLIERIRHAAPRAWFLGIGVSFSFVCGEVQQAPRWMRRVGLEWVHRMVQEPGRLFRRYVIEDIPFALRLMADVSEARRRS